MKPGIIYKGSFKNLQTDYTTNLPNQQTVHVELQDMENLIDDSATETVIDLEMAENPLKISVIDNDEDKFTPIRAKQCEIVIYSSNGIDISTFAQGGDKKWRTVVYINDPTYKIFIGFLSVSDCSMEWQPDPNEITLTATDGIGSLKNIPLTDSFGNNPRGKNRIIDYIAWALTKTGHLLEIWAINNIREVDYPGSHFYEAVYLEAKTFEKEIGESEDCYSVLEKILGESCFLTQWKGRWYIMNIDELEQGLIYQARWNAFGLFTEFIDPTNFEKEIGKQYDADINTDGEELSWFGYPSPPPFVSLERPAKSVIEKFELELPSEILDNIDFALGTLTSFDNVTLTGKFSPTYWTLERVGGGVEIEGYIRKVFYDINMTYEKERYVVLGPGATALHWLKSNPVYLHENDKINFSVERRLSANQGGSGPITEFFAQLRLVADDGTFYTSTSEAAGSEGEGEWMECNSTFTTNQRYVKVHYRNEQTKEGTEWLSGSLKSKGLPKSGKIYVLLLNSSIFGTGMETHFSNLVFDYVPYINGGYSKYSAQQHKVSQTLDTVFVREKQVYLSDSPKQLFKGAMFKVGALDFVLTERFYPHNVFPAGVPADEFIHPYGHLQVFAVYNQFNRIIRKFEGDIDGIMSYMLGTDGLPDLPDLIYKYKLTDINPNTTDGIDYRYFQLLHYEMDLHLCEWGAVLMEVWNSASPKQYPLNQHEFKYIT